jgi:hypothetical protein
MNVHKFINIHGNDPIGVLDKRMGFRMFQRRELNAAIIIGAIIANMGELAHLLQSIQHRVVAIFAIIRIDQDIGEPDRFMMRKPFHIEMRLRSSRLSQLTNAPFDPIFAPPRDRLYRDLMCEAADD